MRIGILREQVLIMKNRFLLKLAGVVLASSVVFSYGGIVLADGTDDAGIPDESQAEETDIAEQEQTYDTEVVTSDEVIYIPECDFDNDELAEMYIEQNMSMGYPARNRTFDFDSLLDDDSRVCCRYIRSVVKDIAAGNETSTKIVVPESVFKYEFTAEELGIDDFNMPLGTYKSKVDELVKINIRGIMDILMQSCPYEMYWFDKTYGCGMTYSMANSIANGESVLKLYNFTFNFYVAEEYQGSSNLSVDPAYGQSVSSAVENARQIIETNAGLSDFEKLLAYNNEICLLTDYNHEAVEDAYRAYGNPWQLIWVFDGDDSTKVVCEGYAKAFKYLCDNSTFQSSAVYALLVDGKLEGYGHMWNVVHMDDGLNYCVDVTNSDPNKEGQTGQRLFLVGATSGSVGTGYEYLGKYVFEYDSRFLSMYSEEELEIASHDYDPGETEFVYTLTLDDYENGSVSLNKTEAHAGEEIIVTCEADDGYELDSIKVNGNKINGNKFNMLSEDVTVTVTFKVIDYSITVDCSSGGTATVSDPAANYGDEVTVTATPDKGYEVYSIIVNGVVIDGNTFTMPNDDVTIFVTFKKKTYSVSLSSGEGGSASVSKTSANYNDEITVTVSADTGYELDTIKVNGTAVSGNRFRMPDEDAEVTVTFKKTVYTITITDVVGGTVSTSKTTATYGENIVITVNADEGYTFRYLFINDRATMKLSFQMPAKDVIIMVVFSADFFPVEVTSSEGGTASYPDFLAEYNSTVYITIEPDEGYELDYITVNGERIDGTSFTMPDNTAQVYVAFKKITYAVEVVSGPNGTASVAEDHACWGDEVTVLVTPDEGYILDTVKVNGEAILGRRFTMPVEDVVIEVTFKEKDTTRNGWILEDGRYYYFRDGDMVTGWVRSGSWYYLDPDNYYMVTGWNQIEGSTYYFTESGSMVTGWKQIAGAWYYFENSGAMAKNWKKLGNKWYYLERDSGAMLTGWYTDGDKEYYLASDGAMTTGWKKIDDSWYYFAESGALTKGWKSIGGKWYFLDSEGKMVTGLMRDGSVWYYFESSGAMATGWKKIDGDWFYFESSGAMKTGWLKSGSDWYYLETYGVMVTGWKQIEGSWYYFYDNGIMAYDTTINGYEIGSNGKMK